MVQRKRRLRSSSDDCGGAIAAICAGRSAVLCPHLQWMFTPLSLATSDPTVSGLAVRLGMTA